jgi:hypothetical protein
VEVLKDEEVVDVLVFVYEVELVLEVFVDVLVLLDVEEFVVVEELLLELEDFE